MRRFELRFDELTAKFHDRIRRSVPMREHTTFRIGGPALGFFEPESFEELSDVLNTAHELDVPVFIMGNGSNLLVSDNGIKALVIKIGESLSEINIDGSIVTSGAGALLSNVARQSIASGLMGLELISGIPGTIGGALAMNAGSYGAQIGDFVVSVKGIKNGKLIECDIRDGDFGYRTSSFGAPEFIVCEATLKLKPDDGGAVGRMAETSRLRREKQPLTYPSAGSVFKRPEGHFAGALIDNAGLKGFQIGGAQVSELHAGFIVNKGGATCSDVLNLIYHIQKTVFDKFGVMLETEVKYIGG